MILQPQQSKQVARQYDCPANHFLLDSVLPDGKLKYRKAIPLLRDDKIPDRRLNFGDVRVIPTHWTGQWPDFATYGAAQIVAIDKEEYSCSLLFACPRCGELGAIRIFATTPPEEASYRVTCGDKNIMTWTIEPPITRGCCGWRGQLHKGVFKTELAQAT